MLRGCRRRKAAGAVGVGGREARRKCERLLGGGVPPVLGMGESQIVVERWGAGSGGHGGVAVKPEGRGEKPREGGGGGGKGDINNVR